MNDLKDGGSKTLGKSCTSVGKDKIFPSVTYTFQCSKTNSAIEAAYWEKFVKSCNMSEREWTNLLWGTENLHHGPIYIPSHK